MLGYATIVAPYDGVITKRSVDTGHLVQQASGSAAEPLVVIARADVVRVFVDIPETEAPLVTSGSDGGDPAAITVQALGGRTFESSVVRTSWTLNPANRSLLAEIDVANPEGLLRPGMFASIRVQLDERRDVLSVPAAAVVREGTQTLCCTVVAGKIARKPVEVGLRVGEEIEVMSGLTEKDQVVLARAANLKEGQSVEVLSASTGK
jgi:RND family efflux transporter MFP subunit